MTGDVNWREGSVCEDKWVMLQAEKHAVTPPNFHTKVKMYKETEKTSQFGLSGQCSNR